MAQKATANDRVAQAVKEIRQTAGLSQTELALAVGVGQSTISHWETGQYSPGFDEVAALEKACRHPKGAVYRIAGLVADSSVADLLLTDPELTPALRKIAREQYRLQVQLARSQDR